MGEFTNFFGRTRRYLVSYIAYAGSQSEYEIQGENCRIFSDHDMAGNEIAAEIARHIQQQDGYPVRRVVIHRLA